MFISFRTIVRLISSITLMVASHSAFSQSMPISPSYLSGVWKEDAQCLGNEAMVFFPNNTMSSAGSVPVNYTVSGPSQIMMYGPGGTIPIGVQSYNQNSMIVTFQGNAMLVHRCGVNYAPPPQHHQNANVNAGYIMGRWSHTGNCANPEVFSANGHFQASTHQTGNWTVFGNTLRLTFHNGNVVDFVVQIIGGNNMTLTQVNQVNNASSYMRC